jgi:glucuronoarabinoxylan endo-1,4-beta-xylanase
MKILKGRIPLIVMGLSLMLCSNCKKENSDNPDDIAIDEYGLVINPDKQFQTIEGFGASLAFYEGWLTAHPNKKEIYDAIFNELSLDILRVRTTYDYDAGMIARVKEFVEESTTITGKPVKVLSTSWGPPSYLKSNRDRTHGGTLNYTISGTNVEFNYSGFANWWKGALNEYNSNGVYPAYISIQNEPDFTADYESCRLSPLEKITATDTMAGYNKALEAVYKMIEERTVKPKLLGPETVGVGYNSVENYVNALNTSYLYGIAHHLYHGVNSVNPWISTDIAKVGNLRPEIPHFQTEYSLGDWFSLAGLMYKSLNDENVVAYLYWQLIWDQSGLIALDFPWDKTRWTNSKGYTKTKDYYVFKQFSAFIHPGWKRTEVTVNNNVYALAFINSARDSISLVLINRSAEKPYKVKISVPSHTITKISAYRTSLTENCSGTGIINNSEVTIPQQSITTVMMSI